MKTTLGTDLNYAAKQDALARFVHRQTVEMRARHPSRAAHMDANGYRMPIITDAQWLACTRFRVTKSGRLSQRNHYCETQA